MFELPIDTLKRSAALAFFTNSGKSEGLSALECISTAEHSASLQCIEESADQCLLHTNQLLDEKALISDKSLIGLYYEEVQKKRMDDRALRFVSNSTIVRGAFPKEEKEANPFCVDACNALQRIKNPSWEQARLQTIIAYRQNLIAILAACRTIKAYQLIRQEQLQPLRNELNKFKNNIDNHLKILNTPKPPPQKIDPNSNYRVRPTTPPTRFQRFRRFLKNNWITIFAGIVIGVALSFLTCGIAAGTMAAAFIVLGKGSLAGGAAVALTIGAIVGGIAGGACSRCRSRHSEILYSPVNQTDSLRSKRKAPMKDEPATASERTILHMLRTGGATATATPSAAPARSPQQHSNPLAPPPSPSPSTPSSQAGALSAARPQSL